MASLPRAVACWRSSPTISARCGSTCSNGPARSSNSRRAVTWRSPASRAGFDELLAQSDFVVCLAAATEDTENLMNAAAFAAMQPGAFFINAARGNLVDEDALVAALDAGTIAGCALDVGRAPDQMPSPAVARHPRAIATPHIGGLSDVYAQQVLPMLLDNAAALAVGDVGALVNRVC